MERGFSIAVEFFGMIFVMFDSGVRSFRSRYGNVVLGLGLNLVQVFVWPKQMGLRYDMLGHKSEIVGNRGTSGSRREIIYFLGLGLWCVDILDTHRGCVERLVVTS
jgi:hypothetical protein